MGKAERRRKIHLRRPCMSSPDSPFSLKYRIALSNYLEAAFLIFSYIALLFQSTSFVKCARECTRARMCARVRACGSACVPARVHTRVCGSKQCCPIGKFAIFTYFPKRGLYCKQICPRHWTSLNGYCHIGRLQRHAEGGSDALIPLSRNMQVPCFLESLLSHIKQCL